MDKYTKGIFEKHVSIWGIYRYIRSRWVKIVFDLFLRRTPGFHRTPRIWISAHVGYICIRRTAYRRPTTYIIYYYHRIRYFILYYYSPHRYRLRTYRDPNTNICGTGIVRCKYVHRGIYHRLTYLLLTQYRLTRCD